MSEVFQNIYEALLKKSRTFDRFDPISDSRQFGKHLRSLVDIDALAHKDEDGYLEYRAHLSGEYPHLPYIDPDATDSDKRFHAMNLSRFINKHGVSVDHPMIVYRGFSDPKIQNRQVIQHPLGLSTTLRPQIAKNFASTAVHTPTILKIHVPAGTKFMPDPENRYREDELTFAPGAKLHMVNKPEILTMPWNVLHRSTGTGDYNHDKSRVPFRVLKVIMEPGKYEYQE